MTSFPKPPPRKLQKARKAREDAKRAKAFREQVWTNGHGYCAQCHTWLDRPGDNGPLAVGHVHHLRGRNVAPEDRYNVDAAVLLCSVCHHGVHSGKLTLP